MTWSISLKNLLGGVLVLFSGVCFNLDLLIPIATASEEVKDSCLDSVSRLNYELAFQQCEYEAERGSAVAAEILGFVYLKGKSGIRDWDLARRYFEQARNAGLKHASGFLGVIYWHGLGVESDEAKARSFFAECADIKRESNHVSCTALYARTLSLESNLPQVRAEGIVWYGKLIEAGEYVYLYNFASQAARLGRWRDAYASAEFFKMWAKRYGELWNLRQKYQGAERISARALAYLSSQDVEELSIEVRRKLNSLEKQPENSIVDCQCSDEERVARFLRLQE